MSHSGLKRIHWETINNVNNWAEYIILRNNIILSGKGRYKNDIEPIALSRFLISNDHALYVAYYTTSPYQPVGLENNTDFTFYLHSMTSF